MEQKKKITMNTKPTLYSTEEVDSCVKPEFTKDLRKQLYELMKSGNRSIGCSYIDMSHAPPEFLRKPLVVSYESKAKLENHLEEMLIDNFHPQILFLNNTLIPYRKVDRLKKIAFKRISADEVNYKLATFQLEHEGG